jgi:phage terminase small subunit
MPATDDAAHPSSPRPLSPRQLRFVQEVRRDGQATPAARRAGYSPRSARWAAYRLMRDPRVRALLAPARPGADDVPAEETGAWALAELKRLAAGNILDFAIVRPDGALEVDLARLERDRTAAVREVTVVEKTAPDGAVTRLTRLKLADKSLALARLLRFSDLWSEGHLSGVSQGQGALLLNRPEVLLELSARKKRELGWVDPPAA